MNAPARQAQAPAAGIKQLAAWYARNRFMPIPGPNRGFVGDGDFRTIGAEFLTHFVCVGGLRPTASVLDLGCGIGRMALPLTQYLDPAFGRYLGIDVVADAIDWCARTISPVYPNFRFAHVNALNEVYNPQGRIRPESVRLPLEDGSIDFAILTSVFTHFHAPAVVAYCGELRRVLRPGGRAFITFFLMTPDARERVRGGQTSLPFGLERPGVEYHADPEHPLAAVAFDPEWVLEAAGQAGLRLALPIAFGCWSGGTGLTYQDVCIFEPVGG